jgi:hypothetical protein
MPSPQGTITDRNLELVLRIGSKVIKTDIKQNTFLSNAPISESALFFEMFQGFAHLAFW